MENSTTKIAMCPLCAVSTTQEVYTRPYMVARELMTQLITRCTKCQHEISTELRRK